MRTLHTFALLCTALLPGLALAQTTARPDVQLEKAWEVGGLARPESALYDADHGVVYVSSIDGDGGEKDGKGFISRLSAGGEVLAREWVGGLNAPKGMALHEGRLYVSDIDELVVIDTETGRVIAHYPAEGAGFLNDVAADSAGRVYVTDSRTGFVYRLTDGELSKWLEHASIKAPNGIYVEPSGIIIAAGDGSTENPGRDRYLQTVSLDGITVKPLRDKAPLGAIDAIETDGRGGYFLSDWGAGQVTHFTAGNGPKMLVQLGQGTADLDYVPETEMLFLPVMMSDRIIAYRVEWAD